MVEEYRSIRKYTYNIHEVCEMRISGFPLFWKRSDTFYTADPDFSMFTETETDLSKLSGDQLVQSSVKLLYWSVKSAAGVEFIDGCDVWSLWGKIFFDQRRYSSPKIGTIDSNTLVNNIVLNIDLASALRSLIDTGTFPDPYPMCYQLSQQREHPISTQ